MPNCVNCGAPNRDGARFCQACGEPMAQVAGSTPAPAPTPTPAAWQPADVPTQGSRSVRMFLLGGMGIYVAGGILTLLSGDLFGFVLCAVLVGGLYVGAIVPLQKGQTKRTQIAALVTAAVSLFFAFLDLLTGGVAAAMFNFVAALVVGLAWMAMRA